MDGLVKLAVYASHTLVTGIHSTAQFNWENQKCQTYKILYVPACCPLPPYTSLFCTLVASLFITTIKSVKVQGIGYCLCLWLAGKPLHTWLPCQKTLTQVKASPPNTEAVNISGWFQCVHSCLFQEWLNPVWLTLSNEWWYRVSLQPPRHLGPLYNCVSLSAHIHTVLVCIHECSWMFQLQLFYYILLLCLLNLRVRLAPSKQEPRT